MKFLFWLSLGFILYTYLGYPILVVILAALKNKRIRKKPITPKVSLLITAYNEEGVIRDKIENSFRLDYPRDSLEIVVVSDGSTDRTNEIVKEYSGQGVILHEYPSNSGKVSALNKSIPEVKGEILVFTDTSSMLSSDSIRELTSNFADSSVGCVTGDYIVLGKKEAALGEEEDFYWKYETFIKEKETRIGSILGAHGSLYAIRKELYSFPEDRIINDDYWIPMEIIKRRYRAIYEPKAVATEVAEMMGGFSRRLRIAVGNYQQLFLLKSLFKPFRGWLILQFFSHKVLRLVVPWFFVTLLVSNFFLRGMFYLAFLSLQLVFYGLAFWGMKLHHKKGIEIRLVKLPYYLCMINCSFLIGLCRFLRYGGRVTWKKQKERT